MPSPERPAPPALATSLSSPVPPGAAYGARAVRLVATDLDNTLLRSDKTVSPRTDAALRAAAAAGITVVPVTARQRLGLVTVAPQFVELADSFGGWAVCSNGALGLDLVTGRRLFEATMNVADQRDLVVRLTAAVPDVRFCAVRDGGDGFLVEAGYAELSVWADHNRDPRRMQVVGRSALADTPNNKMVARHPVLTARDLLDAFRALDLPGLQATSSGAPFLEVSAAGVGKAYGLQRLTDHLGIAAAQVVALGDGLNDLDMLAWAGWGVAMANAEPELRAAADQVAPGCDEDGFAQVLEALIARAATDSGAPATGSEAPAIR
ncbi:HAD family hydrolase [Raineyella sp. LH-20]|uniref:HAD family hydrolase n=1 Tax=Raineyella sp. LH-20 TaxID=3081204 RepID=UPI00295308B6|nr:HAD family hydrolase [Raineyella sp. LH-20]WOP19116.1 HAD family hydrolase [Raineyella sp. LH-20]